MKLLQPMDLSQRHFLAPRAFAFCDDKAVCGAEFFVMERRSGVVVRTAIPDSMRHHADLGRLIAPHLRDGALVVFRSTVYPGTTAYVAQHLAEAGCRVDVAFCPERIAEGHALEELHSLPQIVGADDEIAAGRATALFGHLASKIIQTSTKEAELAKLFTNTWRYMKFAVANQFFVMERRTGDVVPRRSPIRCGTTRLAANSRWHGKPWPVQSCEHGRREDTVLPGQDIHIHQD